MKVIEHQPPRLASIPDSEHVIFLAGPIQGAPLWQQEAIEIFRAMPSQPDVVHAANPRRDYLDEAFDYNAQVTWEKEHLRRAARHGAIIFWFAARDLSQPYEEGRSYAQTSRIELGRIFGWMDAGVRLHLVLGIEKGYKGSENYFRTCAEEFNITVHTNLEDVCEETMEKIG